MKLLALLVLLAVLWTAGLLAFGARVARSTPAPDPPEADGIVALTGTSSLRIEAAAALLEDGSARRLLISGVNRQATRAQIREVIKAAGRKWDCCVDLGFRAQDTQGNAREIAGWAAYHKYRRLIVVTSDYHIPRSVLELHAVMPDLILYPYPVATDLDAKHWWRKGSDSRRMVLEYCKYLVILGREAILSIGRRHGPAPAPPEAKPA
jgi:uncharacterized SAM-binding protein YcdF (DUF218 family)